MKPAVQDLPKTLEEFWKLAEAAQSTASHLANERIRAIEDMGIEDLRALLLHYRWYTSFFPGDLGILICKLPPSSLRSLLGELLNEELGNGDCSRTHLELYDRFLESIGVRLDAVRDSVHPLSLALLEANRSRLLMSHYMFGVGLRGMGGECLCQVYLEAVNYYLRRNKSLERHERQIDWTFWDLHSGDSDREHREQTRDCIARLARPEDLANLSLGYLEAEQGWKAMWEIAFSARSDSRSYEPSHHRSDAPWHAPQGTSGRDAGS